MSLSVIIPSKTASNLVPCIQAVLANEPGIKILVIDDGLPLDLHIVADPPVIATRVYGPFVFARNINIGIVAVGEDDCVLLNDDAILKTPGGFTLLQRAAQEHPEYGVIAASCNNVGNVNQNPRGIGLREDLRMVCFTAVLIPRRTIDLVGLLDPEFVGYGFEDDSYCLRVRRAGLKIGIHDGCYVDHASLPSTFRTGHYPRALFDQNEQIFRAKYGAGNGEL